MREVGRCGVAPDEGASDDVNALCGLPDDGRGRKAIAGCGSGIRLVDLRMPGKELARAEGVESKGEEVNAVGTSADGALVAAAGDSGEVRVGSLAPSPMGKGDGEEAGKIDMERTRPSHSNIATSVAFLSPSQLLSGGADCEVALVDTKRRRRKRKWSLAEIAPRPDGGMVNPPLVNSVASPPGATDLACVASGDGSVAILHLESGDGRVGVAHSSAATCACFVEAGERLVASGGNDCACAIARERGIGNGEGIRRLGLGRLPGKANALAPVRLGTCAGLAVASTEGVRLFSLR